MEKQLLKQTYTLTLRFMLQTLKQVSTFTDLILYIKISDISITSETGFEPVLNFSFNFLFLALILHVDKIDFRLDFAH